MSFALNSISLIQNNALASNSRYAQMSANQARMNLASNPCQPIKPNMLMRAENQLTFTSLTAGLTAKIAEFIVENSRKKLDKDVKREFNYFA